MALSEKVDANVSMLICAQRDTMLIVGAMFTILVELVSVLALVSQYKTQSTAEKVTIHPESTRVCIRFPFVH